MRTRRILGAFVIVLALGTLARAQCDNLAVPGLNGCGNSTPFGIPTIACSGAPTIGNPSFAISANIPCQTSIPILLLGQCLPAPVRIGGPFGPGGFCGPSEAPCLLFVGPTIHALIRGVVGASPFQYTFPLPIPNDATLQGLRVCAQDVSLCSLSPGSCIAASQGISVTLM